MKYATKKIIGAVIIFVIFCLALLILSNHLGQHSFTSTSPVTINPETSTTASVLVETPSTTVPSSSLQTQNVPQGSVPVIATGTAVSVVPSESPEQLLKNMHLTFDDEFNDFSRYVDSQGNVTCNSGGSGTWQTVYDFCSRTIPTNYEAEVYIDPSFLSYLNSTKQIPTQTASPFTVNSGILSIEAAPIDPIISSAVGAWAKYTSGLITTQFSFSQEYGYFEMRAKLPVGKGLWPAFWLLPVSKQWPPEIDALEAFGGPNSKGEGGNTMIHYQSILTDQSKSCGGWTDTKQDITNNFHTYGVDVEKNGITYYFDGQVYAQCPPNPQTNQLFYMLIDLAVGSSQSWPGSPDLTNNWPAFLNVDYVRAYQSN